MYRSKGHTMILMELTTGGKTFRDFKDLNTAVQFLLDVKNAGGQLEDQFLRLDIFVFQDEISRYRLLQTDEITKLMTLTPGITA